MSDSALPPRPWHRQARPIPLAPGVPCVNRGGQRCIFIEYTDHASTLALVYSIAKRKMRLHGIGALYADLNTAGGFAHALRHFAERFDVNWHMLLADQREQLTGRIATEVGTEEHFISILLGHIEATEQDRLVLIRAFKENT
jgi:hypothetical protein